MFSVVNVYLDHLKLCVVCINGRRYVCCSECNVVSNECYDLLTSEIQKHKQNIWKEHLDAHWDTGTTHTLFGRPYMVYPTEHHHTH